MLFPSAKYVEWHKAAAPQVPRVKQVTPTAVRITLYSPTAAVYDLTNKAESIMDLLVDCGVIEDDNYKIVPEVTLLYGGIDRKTPRAEIEFYEPRVIHKEAPDDLLS